MRIGTGWDIHKLVPNRKLVIGGVIIPSNKGELGHSDGDALIHAVIDAILGALAMGDIGSHFPPTDEAWKDADSMALLSTTLEKLTGYHIVNLDTTIILQAPKLRDHIDNIRGSIAKACGLALEHVSVKAKTAEHMLGELGSGDAICAQAVVLLEEDDTPDQWV